MQHHNFVRNLPLYSFVHKCCCHFAKTTTEFSNSVDFSALIFTFFKNQRTVALFFLFRVGTAYEKLSPILDFSIYYVCIVCFGYIPKFPE